MVSLPFSVFIEKIISGEKKQTIRLFKAKWQSIYKNWLEGKQYQLQFYQHFRTPNVSKIIPDEPLSKLVVIYLENITEKIAKDDGFDSKEQCIQWFRNTYDVDFKEQQLIIIFW